MIAKWLVPILLIAFATTAEAGLIVSPHMIANEPSDAALVSVLTELVGTLDTDLPRCEVFDSAGDDLAAGVLVSVQTLGTHAWTGSGWDRLPPPAIGWRLQLSNAILPASPVLDGLLKPS